MSAQALLHALFRYKASIDDALLDALFSLADDDGTVSAVPVALRVLNHATIVDEIFIAHLQQMAHGVETTWRDEVPTLTDLASRLRAADRWYVHYTSAVTAEALDTAIEFTFTDGGRGRMSRAEMLAHVITHGGFHRGEVARLLPEIEDVSQRDVFAGYLHSTEPDRRAQGASVA